MAPDDIQEIFTDCIDIPEGNMRRDIDRDGLFDLAENIKANGLINPITVRRVGERFELIAGQRRFLAHQIAGIIRIRAVVRELDDKKALDIMAAENLERTDVDPVDEGLFLKRLVDEQGSSVGEIAQRINRSEQYVRDRLVVAEMPDYMQICIKNNQLKLGVALVLMQITPESKRRLWTEIAVQDNASIKTAEYWLSNHKAGMLPDAMQPGESGPEAPGGEYRPPMLRCSVDGKEYIASEVTAVFVYKGNVRLIDALREEVAKELHSPLSTPE